MFCLMDVSGSMDEEKKNIAKRFFTLLYLFLTRTYEHIDVVFIRHHTVAEEVDEENFFHSRETGGTVVSSALKLMRKVIEQRYANGLWNIYGAQASDGDNWLEDSVLCYDLLSEQILRPDPVLRLHRDRRGQPAEPVGGVRARSRRPTRACSPCAGSAPSPTSTRCSTTCSRSACSRRLPMARKKIQPLPGGSEWSFESIEAYDAGHRPDRPELRPGLLPAPAGDHHAPSR